MGQGREGVRREGRLLRITKPDDSPVLLDAPLALRERGWVGIERCYIVM